MVSCKNTLLGYALVLLCTFFLMGSSTDHMTIDKRRYQIEDGSRLYLNGTSNVNSFTCACEDQYAGQVLAVERKGGHARFSNVDLLLKSKNFDCHNRKFDNDMQTALKPSQFPYIKFSLVETWQDPNCLDGGCRDGFAVQHIVNTT